MENTNIDINSIVKIETMPKIFSQLEKIGKFIDENIKGIDKLECTEENRQEVKNRRTKINKTLELLETRRKEIKNTLLDPYNRFNEKYEQECKTKLENASNVLKDKVDTIENQLKQEKEDELREFVKQHCEANKIHIKFEKIGLNITLSASMKSLKDQALEFIEKVTNDLKLIELEEYSSEILYEYNQCMDYVVAKTKVIERHKQLEELNKQQEEKNEQEKQEEKVVEKVEEITIPKEVIEEDELLKVTFTLETTKQNIIELKKWLNERGIKYE